MAPTVKIVRCFDNHTPSGTLIRGYVEPPGRFTDEMATNFEDVVLLSL